MIATDASFLDTPNPIPADAVQAIQTASSDWRVILDWKFLTPFHAAIQLSREETDCIVRCVIPLLPVVVIKLAPKPAVKEDLVGVIVGCDTCHTKISSALGRIAARGLIVPKMGGGIKDRHHTKAGQFLFHVLPTESKENAVLTKRWNKLHFAAVDRLSNTRTTPDGESAGIQVELNHAWQTEGPCLIKSSQHERIVRSRGLESVVGPGQV